jgi:hypothetical protein
MMLDENDNNNNNNNNRDNRITNEGKNHHHLNNDDNNHNILFELIGAEENNNIKTSRRTKRMRRRSEKSSRQQQWTRSINNIMNHFCSRDRLLYNFIIFFYSSFFFISILFPTYCVDTFGASAEKFTGTLKLNSGQTEQTIGKFAVRRSGDISVKLSTAKTGWERGRHKLKLLLFEDKVYEEYQRQVQKGSLCDSRCNIANLEHEVDLPHPKATHKADGYEFFEDPESGDSYRVDLDSGNVSWVHPENHMVDEEALKKNAELQRTQLSKWKKGKSREESLTPQKIVHRETYFESSLRAMKPVKGRRGQMYNSSRAAFWYIVVADCALEFYDAKPPPLHFDITIKNNGQHLPSDLSGIGWVYVTNFLFMFFLGLVFVPMAIRMHRKNEKTTHLVVVLVLLAYFFQMSSLLLEILHLRRFVKDGKGLRWRYSFFPADFMAEVTQGFAEFITTMTLLFLVCGWTTTAESESLTSSVAKVFSGDSSLESGSVARRRTGANFGAVTGAEVADDGERKKGRPAFDKEVDVDERKHGSVPTPKTIVKGAAAIAKGILGKNALENPETKRILVSITSALRSPGYLFKKLPDGLSLNTRRLSAGGMIIGFNAILHFILEAWGRRYEATFNSFHDHEHLPGLLLVLLRLVHAAVFVVGGRTAIAATDVDRRTKNFIRNFRIVGLIWLLSFPAVVFVAKFMKKLWQRRFVAAGCTTLQTIGLCGLASLVLLDDSFMKLSSISGRGAAASFYRGGKTSLGIGKLRTKVSMD